MWEKTAVAAAVVLWTASKTFIVDVHLDVYKPI